MIQPYQAVVGHGVLHRPSKSHGVITSATRRRVLVRFEGKRYSVSVDPGEIELVRSPLVVCLAYKAD